MLYSFSLKSNDGQNINKGLGCENFIESKVYFIEYVK